MQRAKDRLDMKFISNDGISMIRRIKEKNIDANIVAIDYDPGATKINQENRIKLMLANAR